ncbi:C13 family peptidase [Chitinilyticum piscinae]|uniref:Peptidase C13 family protein n=1 Tax=Chitinilyticum piscinae TaxID=2866724 RepID=A0A8J7FQ27_9NEIS|nr:C13 family peptidase [Chitinilyticum piscinae]MBE9610154.1 hypothetical protein [Chitinilyticum piscinae]
MRQALATPFTTALRTLCFLRVPVRDAPVPRWPVLPLLALLLLTALAGQLAFADRLGELNWWALPGWLLQAFLVLLLTSLLAARADSPAGWVALQLHWAQGMLLTVLLFLPVLVWVSPGLTALAQGWGGLVFYLLIQLWQLLALAFCLVRWQLLGVWRALILVAVLLLVSLAQIWLYGDSSRLWSWPEEVQEGGDVAPPARLSESRLYSEAAVLQERLSGVASGVPGRPELFAISVGGDGDQQVFLRESGRYASLISEKYGSQAHTLWLANSPQAPEGVPMASLTSIDAAIRRMAAQMNRDEDALLLYLTSHGSAAPGHQLLLSYPGVELEQLDPRWLRRTLDEVGVRWRIIIVSACYSGGYLAPLASPETLVMTAADARNTSFGCADENEFTDFGQALYAGLAKSPGWREAFASAASTVRERERQQGLTPSNPQWQSGAAIAPKLAGWFRRPD